MLRISGFSVLGALILTAISGCSTGADDVGSAEGAATPGIKPTAENPYGLPTPYELANTCTRLFRRHEAVHDVDLQKGTVRWGCGDVPGVTAPDLGQEYCEYNAVQNGAILAKPADAVADSKVSCVFTSVFSDAFGADTTFVSTGLQQPMAAPENLGAPAAEPKIVQMAGGFNSRGAANALVDTCTTGAADAADIANRERVAACVIASTAGAPALTEVCKKDLSVDANWAEATALGVKVATAGEAGFEAQRDLTSCMAVGKIVKYDLKGLPPAPYPQVPYILSTVGVPWRNSDPMICSRVSRSTDECSCEYKQATIDVGGGQTYQAAIPDSVKGFEFTGWVDDHIPSECRLAKIDNADYPYIVICDLSAQDVADAPLNPKYARSMQDLCHDRFGVNLVLKAPLRLLETPGTCKDTGSFCREYTNTSAPAAPIPPGEATSTGTSNRTNSAPPPPPPTAG